VAHQLLQEMILDLRLAPGAFVNELMLATELGLGRMPVREAIAHLAQDRFITVIPRRGAVVTPLALDDVLDIFEAREAIWSGVAYIAATRATTEDLDILRGLVATVDVARHASDAEKFLVDDFAVHTYLARMVRNPLLQDAADVLLRHSMRFWRLYWRNHPTDPDAMLSHAALIEALERHDAPAAVAAMRSHLQASRQLVQRLF
jgi:DNA-binding GntR family transcriptional regulator